MHTDSLPRITTRVATHYFHVSKTPSEGTRAPVVFSIRRGQGTAAMAGPFRSGRFDRSGLSIALATEVRVCHLTG